MKKVKSKARNLKSSKKVSSRTRKVSQAAIIEGGNDLVKIIIAAVAGLLLAFLAYYYFTVPAQTPSKPIKSNVPNTQIPLNQNQF